jgi:hypothetical protein
MVEAGELTQREVDNYQIEQQIKSSTQETTREDNSNEYVENDLELKNQVILNPRASKINRLNTPDLMLGIIKDPTMMKQINWWKEMQIIFLEAGMFETAQVYENMVLTTLNLYRSQDGQQQINLITRIKAADVKLNPKKESNFTDKIKQFYILYYFLCHLISLHKSSNSLGIIANLPSGTLSHLESVNLKCFSITVAPQLTALIA